VVFLLQNNQWAISTPRAIQTSGADFASRGPAYGFPGVSVDGNDLFAMHKVMSDAIRRGREGKGATLVEAVTYRMGMHTTADDPTRYVDPAERERWAKKDPIIRVQKYLAAQGLWDDDRAGEWEAAIHDQVEEAFAQADAYPAPKAEAIYEHVFAEMTPTLSRQRAEHLGAEG
jgi:pyruvate dehydrogenase E1 component alpha subunit